MLYLESFQLPDYDTERKFILDQPHQLNMSCYSSTNTYPFKLFHTRQMPILRFAPITVFYGGNGSGKSTILNLISEKLGLDRKAPFNRAQLFTAYLNYCECQLARDVKKIPRGSRIITSDDVFEYLLNLRNINEGVGHRREELFDEYKENREAYIGGFKGIADYDEFRRQWETKTQSKSEYVARRLPKELDLKSNGESAFGYFTQQITEHALYILDEPENSLSAERQMDLARFMEDSARFYHCQFVLSTHSPFLLAMKGAAIYDLDSVPVERKNWTTLPNVRRYYDFFEAHREAFEKQKEP